MIQKLEFYINFEKPIVPVRGRFSEKMKVEKMFMKFSGSINTGKHASRTVYRLGFVSFVRRVAFCYQI